MVSNIPCSVGVGCITPKNNCFIPHSVILRNWGLGTDSFSVDRAKSYEDKEIARLFPNGELNQIYNKIANDYGLENPPELELIDRFEQGDRGYYSASNNKIKIVLDFLKPNAQKFLTEKDGQSFYMVGDSKGLLFRYKNEDIQKEINLLKSYGLKAQAVPLTDDDKKKTMIFLLAHELSHAYQNQCIRHTEGLNEWDMIEQRYNQNKPKGMNLINNKLLIIDMKKMYDKTHSKMSFNKVYSKNSPEGQQAKIWYDATIGYKRPEESYQDNVNNPLEVYANNKAFNYLSDNYGYFDGAITF